MSPGPDGAAASYQGLLIDFGGVLTSSVFDSFQSFCAREGLDADALRRAFREDPAARKLIIEFECGRIDEAGFEPRLAGLLGVDGERLIDRLFAGVQPDTAMLEAVAAARRAGIRTGLVSNSWGGRRYDRARFPELFDGVVISDEVGLRKPDPAIYELAAGRVGLEPAACVFVDDLPHNLEPARALGMATVQHVDAAGTVAELERLLGVSLR